MSRADTGSSQISSSGSQRESAGDADALALAAGELVRIALQRLRAEPHLAQELVHPRAPLGGGALRVHDQRLLDDAPDRGRAD